MGLIEAMLPFNKEEKVDVYKLKQDVENAESKIATLTKDISDHSVKLNQLQLSVSPILSLLENFGFDSMEKLISSLTQYNEAMDVAEYESKCNFLTASALTKQLQIPGLNQTELKYYLYEEGLLAMTFNPMAVNSRINYRISEEYNSMDHIFKNYIHIDSPSKFSFDPEIIPLLLENIQKIRESLERNKRRKKRFDEAKKSLLKKESNNYRSEINKICGTSKNDDYSKKKYGKLYKQYSITIGCKSLFDEYNKIKNEKYMNDKYYSLLRYIIEERHHGDILLKIACELFVS